MKRIALFVDVSNLYFCVKRKYEGRIDYKKYMAYVQSLGEVIEARAYGCAKGAEAKAFMLMLKHAGFAPVYKEPKELEPGKRKGDWDVGITVDMLTRDDADVVILGSSDSDMAPAVAELRKRGKEVYIFACDVSRELHGAASCVFEIAPSHLQLKGAK